MRVGAFVVADAEDSDATLRQIEAADEVLDPVGIQDHPYQPRFLETWTLLTFAAARRRSIQLVAGVVAATGHAGQSVGHAGVPAASVRPPQRLTVGEHLERAEEAVRQAHRANATPIRLPIGYRPYAPRAASGFSGRRPIAPRYFRAEEPSVGLERRAAANVTRSPEPG
jgi:hypothetical protein